LNIINLETRKHNRIGFIGGTDAIKIMRGEWHELWLQKTGQAEPEDLSYKFNVQLGLATEDFNTKWFCQEYMFDYNNLMKQVEYEKTFDGVPYKGTLDAVHESNKFIVECKHTYSFNTYNKMVELYMPQLQFYMGVSGIKKSYFSIIFGNQWECRSIQFDNDYFLQMRDKIQEFWNLVKLNIEPKDQDAVVVDINKIPINDLVRRDASKDNHFTELAETYKLTKQAHKDHDNAKKELRSLILPTESEIYNDKIKVVRDSRGIVKVMEK